MNVTEMNEWFELSGREVDPIVGALLLAGAEIIERAYAGLSDERMSNTMEAMMQATFENYPPTLGEIFEGGDRVGDIFVGWLVWNAMVNATSVMNEADNREMLHLLYDTAMWETAKTDDVDVWDIPAIVFDA